MIAASTRRRAVLVALVLGLVFVPLAFAGGGSADLGFTPSTWSFSVASGSTTSQSFTLSNSGKRSAGTISTISLSGSSAFSIVPGSDTCTGNGLGPRRSCTVSVAYAPTDCAGDSATLTATGEHGYTATAPLTGTGTGCYLQAQEDCDGVFTFGGGLFVSDLWSCDVVDLADSLTLEADCFNDGGYPNVTSSGLGFSLDPGVTFYDVECQSSEL